MAPILRFIISSEPKKKEPRYACLKEAKAAHTQNVDCCFLLHTTLPSGVVTQPHYMKMPSRGVMSGKKASDNPGLCPIKGQ
jgi:hypothetical protein